ncbi:DUF6114 domain-containing protein [Nocardioides sp. LML1-1-1.1]|uniref:DUF6114 domain-containing protein n=1 Tax=Nocardioides sp. LML1-1-1.1 TaxID=3135248 RepID=UPI00342CE73C
MGGRLKEAWAWFRAFRRTRPFWGGLWCLAAGAWIIRSMFFSFVLAVSGGWSYSAGYILGGGLVLIGLVSWFAPHYRTLLGIMAVLLALAAFVAANLGGYLLGSVLGILGGSMVWAWGEKAPRRARGGRRRASATASAAS